ncbi:hypothetical protein TSA66_11270 [Noviherbaspirillum autotrophicum]|uniref:Uncharacterized protein n=1 Tax=Noviherbaspirillum autotrophicum TaxID=709839 RepID=A0A0C1Y2G5_9BURK|nr:hypothetical protein TSA66_11270 [Noviherbaspirillum autotrophicum]
MQPAGEMHYRFADMRQFFFQKKPMNPENLEYVRPYEESSAAYRQNPVQAGDPTDHGHQRQEQPKPFSPVSAQGPDHRAFLNRQLALEQLYLQFHAIGQPLAILAKP